MDIFTKERFGAEAGKIRRGNSRLGRGGGEQAIGDGAIGAAGTTGATDGAGGATGASGATDTSSRLGGGQGGGEQAIRDGATATDRSGRVECIARGDH